MERTTLMVFAKAPVAGQCKTRLIPALGEAGAARFQELLLSHTLDWALSLPLCRVELWCAPDDTHPLFQQLGKVRKLPLYTQTGQDLGQRMANAFDHALGSADRAVVVGTDCPQLSASLVSEVISYLRAGDDAVLVPALDGGYVLLGLSRPGDFLFQEIDWSTDRVLQQTEQRLRKAGWRYRCLDPLPDIDRPEDLNRLNESWQALIQKL